MEASTKKIRTLKATLAAAAGATAFLVFTETPSAPKTVPMGEEKSAKTKTLEAGAKAFQSNEPVTGFDIYLNGFHPLKDHPEMQLEAHHYCHQMNEDFAQCVLFDGSTANANLNGIEYIISAKLFESLPEKEKRYWHPHNGEILSGQLIAPGLPQVAEKSLMRTRMNTYGKTWHVWNTGHQGHQADALPFGDPELAWSFNRDGELRPQLLEERDKRMRTDTGQTRKDRLDLQSTAKPQRGVDALKGKFGLNTREITGVADKVHGSAQSGDRGKALQSGK
jgi:hypothetical protein